MSRCRWSGYVFIRLCRWPRHVRALCRRVARSLRAQDVTLRFCNRLVVDWRSSRSIVSSLIGCSCLLGCYYSMAAKLGRLGRGSNRRPPLVHRRQECVIGLGRLHMPVLKRGWRLVLLVSRHLFCLGRAGVDSASAAVVAYPVHICVVDHRRVVNVVNVGDVYVVHRTIVVKLPVLPTPALIAGTAITIAVIHTSVEADVTAPVAAVPLIGIATPTPVTWSPEQANRGCHHPRTRYPEVAFISVGPVAGRPQITRGGDYRLRVYRQCRGSDCYLYEDL
jgi:hypothetical protein